MNVNKTLWMGVVLDTGREVDGNVADVCHWPRVFLSNALLLPPPLFDIFG